METKERRNPFWENGWVRVSSLEVLGAPDTVKETVPVKGAP